MTKLFDLKFARIAVGIAATWTVMNVPVLANDAGLYDAPIPADKSLVRFVNVKMKQGLTLDFSGQKFDVDPVALSGYRILSNGAYKISDGKASVDANLEPGKFYTIAVGANAGGQEGIVVISDNSVENPSKSSLSLYNFSAAPADLSLRLKGQSKVLFDDVAPGAMASKELPVIDIGLEVSEGDKKFTELDNVSLTAKQRQNVVVVDTPNGPTSFLVPTGIEQ